METPYNEDLWHKPWYQTGARLVATALVYAVVVLGLALALSAVLGSGQRDLANRVDEATQQAVENGEMTVHGTAAIVCILDLTEPEQRTDAAIAECLQENGFTEIPVLLDEQRR